MPSDTGVNPAQQTTIRNAQALISIFNQLGYDKVEARDNMASMSGDGSHKVIDFGLENPDRMGDFTIVVYKTLSLPAPLPPDTASTYQMMNAALLVRKIRASVKDPQGLTRSLFETIYGQPDWDGEQQDLAYQTYLSQLTSPLVDPFLSGVYGPVIIPGPIESENIKAPVKS